MDWRTASRTAAMDTFLWDAGWGGMGERRYENWNTIATNFYKQKWGKNTFAWSVQWLCGMHAFCGDSQEGGLSGVKMFDTATRVFPRDLGCYT